MPERVSSASSQIPSMTEIASSQSSRVTLSVVASRVGGVPEVVVDGQTGLLVPPDSPLALAAAIHELLDDPAKTHVLAANARQRAGALFRWSDYVDAYDDRLESALRVVPDYWERPRLDEPLGPAEIPTSAQKEPAAADQ